MHTPAWGSDANLRRVSYSSQVRPLFTKYCAECHGGVKQQGGLSFVYPESLVEAESPVVAPGDAMKSLLFQRVVSEQPGERMPPADHGPALSAKEIDLLRRWIEQGAPLEGHWALVPPEKKQPPTVLRDRWPRGAIDRFVLARLEADGLAPSRPAMRERWLRRVSFGLIGLPPSVEELNAFLKDEKQHGEAAYVRVVDRLLASQHFGERWASVWLDQVRYADSRGLGYDSRRNSWKYRDWVIDAFNRDMPYDEFTVAQLAGDLLPAPTMDDLVATACNRLSQSNDEGGTDDEEFRVEAVLERVDTAWLAWQGLTFGCARCHDHPYEPIRQEEYYAFAAFFNNTRDSDLNEEYPLMRVPISKADYPNARRIDRQIEDLSRSVWEGEQQAATEAHWLPVRDLQAQSNNSTKVEIQESPEVVEFATVGTIRSNTDVTLLAGIPSGVKEITAIRVTCKPLDAKAALADSEWGFVLSNVTARLENESTDVSVPLEFVHVIGDESNPLLDPQESLNEKTTAGFAAYSRIHHPRNAVFVLNSAVPVPSGARLRVVLKHRRQLGASFSLLTRRGSLEVTSSEQLGGLAGDSARADALEQLVSLRAERGKIPSTSLPVTSERPAHLRRPTHLFNRGSQFNKGPEVSPGVPASFPPLSGSATRDRLALAQWLVDPANPLTARVAVNRYWSRMFGVGLVATEEDFGASGDAPSHPDLLDYLAVRFQTEFGWSTKALLREIALSSTYRQSAATPEHERTDPSNRLLARGPRATLSAEMVRDHALASSGLLTRELFGMPAYPPLPDGVWKPFQASDKWRVPPPGAPGRYRRSVYTYTKRSIPYPAAAAFDAPAREACTPRRLRSNTPLQPLFTMNDEAFVECAKALATRMRSHSGDLREQLKYGFVAAVSRQPTAQELSDLEVYARRLTEEAQLEERQWLVASVLLNMDEALTK